MVSHWGMLRKKGNSRPEILPPTLTDGRGISKFRPQILRGCTQYCYELALLFMTTGFKATSCAGTLANLRYEPSVRNRIILSVQFIFTFSRLSFFAWISSKSATRCAMLFSCFIRLWRSSRNSQRSRSTAASCSWMACQIKIWSCWHHWQLSF